MYIHEQIIEKMLELGESIEPPLTKNELVAEMGNAIHMMLTFNDETLKQIIIDAKEDGT